MTIALQFLAPTAAEAASVAANVGKSAIEMLAETKTPKVPTTAAAGPAGQISTKTAGMMEKIRIGVELLRMTQEFQRQNILNLREIAELARMDAGIQMPGVLAREMANGK